MPRVHMHTQPNAIVNHLFPFILFAHSHSLPLTLTHYTPNTHAPSPFTLIFGFLYWAVLCYVRDFPESNQTANRKKTHSIWKSYRLSDKYLREIEESYISNRLQYAWK